MRFGFWLKTALPPNFIQHPELTSTLDLSENFQPTTLLKMGLQPLSSAKNPLREVLSFSALIISWLLFQLGELVVLWQIWTGEVNLAAATAVFPSRGVVPYLPLLFTSHWVRKIRAPLRATSVTISFDRTVWYASKVSLILDTSYVIVWSIVWIAPGMIFGMSRLRIKLCGEFPLVVSISVIFPSFLSLVWVATN